MAMKELAFCEIKSLKYILEGLEGLTCLEKLHMSECECLLEFAGKVSTVVEVKELHLVDANPSRRL